MTASAELDRIGHNLARDERRLHALGAHRDAVAHGDGVHLDRRSTGLADALLDPARELPLIDVAGHDLDPRMRDADQRPLEVLVVVTDSAHHRTCRRAVRSVDHHAAARTWIRCHIMPPCIECAAREGRTNDQHDRVTRRAPRCTCWPRDPIRTRCGGPVRDVPRPAPWLLPVALEGGRRDLRRAREAYGYGRTLHARMARAASRVRLPRRRR